MRFRAVVYAALAPTLVAASQPVRLQPSSPWVVNYAENSCLLIRSFGQGKDKTILQFEADAPGRTDMLVIGRPLDGGRDDISAMFLPVQQKPFTGHSAVGAKTGDPAVLWSLVEMLPGEMLQQLQKEEAETRARRGIRPPPTDLAERAARRDARQRFVSAATELKIEGHPRPLILETGSLGDPIKVFDQCLRDSLRDWGVNPDIEDKIVRPAWAPDATSWFSSNDYPKDMLVRGEQSEVSIRLLVDAGGKVTRCTSTSHFNAPEFNKITCDNIMKRAHLEPAELADGTKVPSYYANRVIFRIAN
jgi:hypothetical protein